MMRWVYESTSQPPKRRNKQHPAWLLTFSSFLSGAKFSKKTALVNSTYLLTLLSGRNLHQLHSSNLLAERGLRTSHTSPLANEYLCRLHFYFPVDSSPAGWTTSQIWHSCLIQKWSQWLAAEKTGRGSLLNRRSSPTDNPMGQGTELNWSESIFPGSVSPWQLGWLDVICCVIVANLSTDVKVNESGMDR